MAATPNQIRQTHTAHIQLVLEVSLYMHSRHGRNVSPECDAVHVAKPTLTG